MGLELARAMVMVRADASALSTDLESAKGTVSAGLSAIQGAIAGVLGGISALGAGFLGAGIASAASFEQTQIAFETMLGSAAETKTVLADLTTFAAQTPFEMPEILVAARGLIQFGERGDELMNTLKFLGDAAAGTGAPFGELALIYNQVRGKGKLLTQDFRQMSERGVISLQDIAKHYHKTTEEVDKMMTTGKISFADFSKIVEKTSLEGGRFANMTGKQSVSLLGLKSTLNDVVRETSRFVATPIAEALKPLIQLSIMAANAVMELVQKFPNLSANLTMAITVVTGLGAAIHGASSVLGFFGVDAAKLMTIFRTGAIAIAIGAAKFLLIGAAIGIAITAVQSAIKWILNLKPVQEALTRASAKFALAWDSIKTAFANVGVALYGVFQNIVTWMAKLLGIDTTSWSATVGSAVSTSIDWIASFVQRAAALLQVMTENWGAVWNLVQTAAGVAFSFVWEIAATTLSNIGKILMSIPGIAVAAFNSMLTVGLHALLALGDAFPHLVTIASATFQSLFAGLMGYVQASNTAWGGVFSVMLKVFEKLPVIAAGAIDAVVFGFNALVGHLSNFPALLQEALTPGGNVAAMLGKMTADVGAKMKEGFMQYGHMEYIAETAKEAIDNTMAEVGKIPGAMSGAFEEAGGGAAIGALTDVLQKDFGEATDAIGKQWEGVMPELAGLGIGPETQAQIDELMGQVSALTGLKPGEAGAGAGAGAGWIPGVGRAGADAAAAAGKAGTRTGLAEYGQKLQESLLKGDVAKATLDENKKQTEELRGIRQTIAAKPDSRIAGLTDENPGAIQGGFGFGV